MTNSRETLSGRLLDDLRIMERHALGRGAIRDEVKQMREEALFSLGTSKKDLEYAEKARRVIQIVAQKTQKNLEFHISQMVSSALAAVWDDPYEFKVRFVSRSNRSECDMFFVRGGKERDPMESSGGGPKDVASFALRIAKWTLKKNRPTFLLDEPFKYVSVDLQPKCSQMLRMLCESLGIQILMVSHLPAINTAAEKEFKVTINKRISKVEEVE